MKKYVAKRDEVCGGLLIERPNITTLTPDTITTENGEVSIEEAKELGIPILTMQISSYRSYRGMLLNVNDDGLSNDLIWTTPTNYPIMGKSTSDDIDFVIDEYVELGELLKYLKYGVDLTQKDLLKIYRKLIVSSYWIEHNMELFGYKKDNFIAGSYTGTSDGMFTSDVYHKLRSISSSKGKPNKEEPGYGYIHKIK